MTVDGRAVALERLRQLRDCLAQSANADSLAHLVEEIDLLSTSVESFHMEAIRFRLFGLRRHLAAQDRPLPDGASGLLDDAGAALEAAGFQIK